MKIIKSEKSQDEVAELREKLAEAEEVLNAMRNGSVDALLVSGQQGDRVYTLKGADHTYRLLIETMTEGAVILSADGLVLYCNGRFAEMVQLSTENVMGSSMNHFVQMFDKNRFAEDLRRAVFEDIRDEVHLHLKNGNTMPVLISMRVLSTYEMKAVCMVVMDLTQQKQSEQKLKEYGDKLRQKNTELKFRAEQLSRLSSQLTLSEQMERRRLAKILHDHLQQLLVAAKMGLEIVSRRTPLEQRRQVEEITELVRESIEASRSLTIELCPPILYEGGLNQALEWLSSWMNKKYGLDIHLEADPMAVPESENMRILLFEAVRELLFNVFKHAGVGSAQVKLIRNDKKYLKIVVSDQGAGFDLKNLEQNTGKNFSGFGLFSMQERLSLVGGHFEIMSAPGKGTVVSLMAPCLKKLTAESASKNVNHTHIDPLRKVGKNIRVMLVDDHAMMRQGLSSLLSFQADIEVVGEAADGEEAVKMARKLIPDIILMDISMPKMNGIEATRIIHSEFPDIRIIGLSMHSENSQAEAIINAGASAYQSKGDNTDLLLAAIRSVVEHP